MTFINKKIILTHYAEGLPRLDNFSTTQEVMEDCPENNVVIRNHFVSADPAQKGWMSGVTNYAHAPLGETMRALGVGEIIVSRMKDYQVGEFVTGWFGWQEYAHAGTEQIIRKVNPAQAPLQTALGVLGINGLTAYIVLNDILSPKKDETLLVSSAAGTVGSIVGQLAKNKGCRVVGLTGNDQKVALACSEFGYDSVINYQTSGLTEALKKACPNGIDTYFDNVAGEISDSVFPLMNVAGRIAQVGTASIASWHPLPHGPRRERLILTRELHHQGFVIFNHEHRFAEALNHLSAMITAGSLKYREEIYEGLEQAPHALLSLYEGSNTGKTLIRLI